MKNNSYSKKALYNTSMNMLVRLMTLLSSFIMKTVMIHYMGIEYTGLSSLFTDILTIFSFAELGIGSAITFALYKPINDKDYQKIAQLMNFYKKAYMLIGSFIFIIGVALIPGLPFMVKNVPNISESITLIYLLYLINTVSSYFLIYKSALLTANQKNYVISFIQVIFNIVRTILGVVMIVLFENFLLYLSFDILLIVIQNIIIFFFANNEFREIKSVSNADLPSTERKRLLGDIHALALYQISNVIVSGTDSIIISSIMGTGSVAFFANYRFIERSVDTFMAQITSSITPTLGNLAINDKERQEENFDNLNFLIFWITAVTALLLYFLTDPFISVWLGKKFILNKWILIGFVVDYILVNLVRPVAAYRNANGLFIQGKYRPLAMAILNVIISIVLVIYLGIEGAIWGTVFSRLITQTWFDPLVLYKYTFKKSVKIYLYQYFKRISVIFGQGIVISLILKTLFAIFKVNHQVISIIIIGIIVFFISNFILWLIYHNKKEFLFIKIYIYKILSRIKKN
ncbi:hypothetical protein HQ875_11035 [Enterococcus faecium]|uniref:Polysaccharide biosynthesis protein n=6 Tax=Enterococcus TaxID=1350 RepID=A0A6N3AWJ6_ENTFC|nr:MULTISPECIES: hypothetical protein [Enterococcus]MBD9836882.1 hypothetical protein [Enterococcus faecium]MCO5428717.1 hypothetical protein [Enterococcus faecium]MDB7367238.1 hypothetical protein [Enterococcus faecium]MDB7521015.1 hypothetical protein [Enterococcus faecium]MDB7523593.1 hypothetical protein [Enterococcus faecium]